MKSYLFNTEKLKYVTGDRPDVPCILCAVRDKHPDVKKYELYRSELSIVTVNLYPFNPGHLLIFPMRHICCISELSTEEALDMHRLLSRSVSIIRDRYRPSGFNIGFNMGHNSGGSIEHIHQHVVPRYPNEVGFLDVLAGTRIMVSDPGQTLSDLKAAFES